MGNWTTAVTELRELLNDQNDDRYCYRKKVFGNIDAVNKSFKSFEFRRITDFTVATGPEGVYVNGVLQAPSAFSADDIATGEFTFVTAPPKQDGNGNGSIITATYYYQWFLDTELSSFLTSASRWLQQGDDFTNIPNGLNQAALYYAAKMAMEKMALRWSTRANNTFLLEDAPKQQSMDVAKTYNEQGASFEKSALDYRNDYYTKSGQSLAAFSVSSWGSVSAVTPRR